MSSGLRQEGKYTPESSDGDEACNRLKRDSLSHNVNDGSCLLLLLGPGCLNLPVWDLLDTSLIIGDDLTIRNLLYDLAATRVELAIVQLDDGTFLRMSWAVPIDGTRASARDSGHKGGIRCNFGEVHVAFLDRDYYVKGQRLRGREGVGNGKMVMRPYLKYCHLV